MVAIYDDPLVGRGYDPILLARNASQLPAKNVTDII